MTTNRIDRILVALGVLLILISSCQLFFVQQFHDRGEKLATLTSTFSVVKIKNGLSLDWRDATLGNDLVDNQLIYTDSDSSAEITFVKGDSLVIGENSLIRLSSQKNEEKINVSQGLIRAKLTGENPLTIVMNGEEVTVTGKNADIQINLLNAKGEIGVLSGEVKVEAKGISETLSKTSAIAINGDQLVKKDIHFVVQATSEIFTAQNLISVKFNWEPLEEASLIISTQNDFTNPIKVSGAGSANLELAPGHYYYKVESSAGSSLIGSFKIIQEFPPIILRPKQGEEIKLFEGTDKIYLQWEAQSGLNYMVEWKDESSHVEKINSGPLAIPAQASGKISWRVRIDETSRPEARWSDWQEITVIKLTRPITPTDLIPDGIEYQTYTTPEEKIEFLWKNSTTSEIEIKTPDGNMLNENIDKNFFEYTAKMPGTYSWRVRGSDAHLQTSDWSEWKTFTITDLSGSVEKEGIQRIQLNRPDQKVTFNWKSEKDETTIFELSRDKNFETIVKKSEVTSDNTEVIIPEVGTYYWRSRHFSSSGTVNVSEPKRVIIEPAPAPSKPEKLPDVEVPLEEVPKTTSFFLDFIISSAHADESSGTVHLSLPENENAKAFIVRITQNDAVVFEQEIIGTKLEWKDAHAGTYYWQYAVVDHWDRKSTFSDPAVLVVKEEASGKPKLLYPIRKEEVEAENLKLKWTTSDKNISYQVEISETEDFKKILSVKENVKPELNLSELKLDPKLYFWRVHARDKKGLTVISNTGRFTIVPPLEKTVIEDHPLVKVPVDKSWKDRGFIAWAPSMDTYNFKDNKSGKIDGNATLGILVKGTKFSHKQIYNAELLRQSGKVFKNQSYLFQRIEVDAVQVLNLNKKYKWGLGLALAQSSGNSYGIDAQDKVSSKSVSGVNYGLVFRNYYSLNDLWEIQSRVQYLLGDIKQFDIEADCIRSYKSYLLLSGIGLSSRDYKLNEGNQNSIRVSLGVGKEF